MSVIRNELQLEQSRAADQEQRANDLEQIMECVKSKIGELEDESINRVSQQQNKIKDLQKEHKALQVLIVFSYMTVLKRLIKVKVTSVLLLNSVDFILLTYHCCLLKILSFFGFQNVLSSGFPFGHSSVPLLVLMSLSS